MIKKIFIEDEFSTLKTVILGDYRPYTLSTKKPQQINIDKQVLNDIEKVLISCNVNVIKPKYNKILNISQSMWVRDSSVVIDNSHILLKGGSRGRKTEFKTINFNKSILFPYEENNNIRLEGGDIIQCKDIVFVGINKRTNILGYEWLVNNFRKKKIIPIYHDLLHLDCGFNILSNNFILYSKKYIKNIPEYCREKFKFVNIDKLINVNFDTNLATNFLSINPKTIIISNQLKFKLLRKYLEELGYNLILIDTKNIHNQSGSIRCLTCPLYRLN